jgi:upstream activation factor subunit UAF30
MVCEKFGPTFTAWRKNGGANRCGATRRKSMPTKTPAKKASPKDGKASGLQKPLQPSQELAAVIGSEHRSRGEVVSKVWDYIKTHNLQNPENRREILADDKLRKVFGKDKVTMFEMNKHLAQHLT